MREGIYDINMIEVVTGAGGEPPVISGAFKANAFSTGFKIGV